MSWLFSQALVEEFWGGSSWAGAQYAQLNGNHIPQAYCALDRMTEFSRLSRFGMMFAPLMESHGEELLTLYLEGFRVKTSAQPELVQESKEPVVDSGKKWHALSVRFDPASSSWKTVHCLWEEVLPWSSVILPRWGMTQNGFVYQHLIVERPISVTASGLWPTPTVQDSEQAGGMGSIAKGKRGLSLHQAAKLYATPLSRDYKSGKFSQRGEAVRMMHSRGKPLSEQIGGALNPMWVEWLMGWPLGWTDLKPLEMGRFQEWQQQHSLF